MVLLYGEDNFIVETETTCLTQPTPCFSSVIQKKLINLLLMAFLDWCVQNHRDHSTVI